MLFKTALVVAVAAVASASEFHHGPTLEVPNLDVPACPHTSRVQYSKSIPDQTDFPLTQVELCYDNTSIQITFTAFNETNYYFNPNHTTNDPIWAYEVMEAFISHGTNDPQTYLEFEINPNNVTFQAIIHNPSKVSAQGFPTGAYFITQPLVHGFSANTVLDKPKNTWVSTAHIPLGLFNVDDGEAKGTEWRMNFFRTVTSPTTYPDQLLGAWNPTNASNFHMTPFFGVVNFV
jgi:hypothetical protein